MAAPIDFVSNRTIEAKREIKRKAQQEILDKAKQKYEREEQKRKERQDRGDDKWMLPAVSESLDLKSKKKRRKKEKEKKSHKKSKKHKRSKSSPDSEDTDGGDQWVEAPSVVSPPEVCTTKPALEKVERDSWMESPFLTATYSQSEIRKEREKKKQEEKEKEGDSINNPGRSARELNPFWKDGGTGLPQEDPSKSTYQSRVGIGDGGTGWLRKSYERVKQQAREEGRSLEELAAERWGSLEKIHKMLEEAEGNRGRPSGGWRKGNERGHGRRDEDERGQYDRGSERDGSSDSSRRRDRGHEHRTEKSFRRPQHPDDGGSSMKRGFRKPSEEASLAENDERRTSRDSRNDDSVPRTYGSMRGKFRKPPEEGSSLSVGRTRPMGLGSLKGQFRKPGEDDSSSRGYKGRESSSGKWRKPGYEKPGSPTREDVGRTDDSRKSSKERVLSESEGRTKRGDDDASSSKRGAEQGPSTVGRKKEKDRGGSRRGESSEDSSSSSPSSSSGEEDEEEQEQPRVLTKDEMNQLGAKIVKAEIMGNEELVKKLKGQLEAARKAGTAKPRSVVPGKKPEEEVVVLSRTNRMGQSYPLPEEANEARPPKGKNKKRGVITHSKDGERERYFGDDDNVDLKTMVQREKMGLAEDQNNMFARAQTRALKSLDEEYTLDDMFVSSASKQSDRDEAHKQRDRAIREHQRMEAALSRCPHCIDSPEMAKHLIVALGIKVYLCLPRTQSLTSGHCQIVPMQHSTACTALDEDVWGEVQIFRKGLTKMFEDLEKDAVFIEYSSDSKKQRHMLLECIPVPRDLGEMAPIYFKKAIQESETEWSQNKKLVDTRKKDIRHSVPKGFPYFSVDFGLDGGFAHVIEDHQLFPHYFGKEVLGGLLDVEPRLWRNPPKENFDSQRRKVMEFAEWWKPFDWTRKIDRENT